MKIPKHPLAPNLTKEEKIKRREEAIKRTLKVCPKGMVSTEQIDAVLRNLSKNGGSNGSW